MTTPTTWFRVLFLLAGLSAGVANGQIFVWGMNGVREYTTSGTLMNDSFITGLGGWTGGIETDGKGNLFLSSNGFLDQDFPAIKQYTTSGKLVNTFPITGSNNISGMACDGNGHLFLSLSQGSTDASGNYILTGGVAEYTTLREIVNTSLITGLTNPASIVLDGKGYIYVACSGRIGKYTTSGQVVNPSLITMNAVPSGMAIDANGFLYVGNYMAATIEKYTTAGASVNAALISCLGRPVDIRLDGNGHLFVRNSSGTVGSYTTSGETVNPSLITASDYPTGLLVITPVTNPPPQVSLLKAVKPSFSNLISNTAYQLQVSSDMNTWTNQGSPFTATNTTMVYPQYWDVDNWDKLFFRLQATQ